MGETKGRCFQHSQPGPIYQLDFNIQLSFFLKRKTKNWLITPCHNYTLKTHPIAIQHACGCSCLGGEDKAVWTKEGRLSGNLMPFFVWPEMLEMLLGQRGVLWIWPAKTWRTAGCLESWRCLLSWQAVTPGNVCKDSKRRICGQQFRKFLLLSSHPF